MTTTMKMIMIGDHNDDDDDDDDDNGNNDSDDKGYNFIFHQKAGKVRKSQLYDYPDAPP